MAQLVGPTGTFLENKGEIESARIVKELNFRLAQLLLTVYQFKKLIMYICY